MSEFLDFLKKEEVKKFILDNRNTSPQKLLLNPPKPFKDEIRIIADQILARQKANGKLKDWSENINLILPPPLSIEQASSQSTSDYKKKILKGDHLIDLTGGMGIDCLALGEQFDKVTYVEQQSNLCSIFKHNCEALGRDIEVKNVQAEEILKLIRNDPSKKTLFVDPARRDDSKNKVFKLEDCTPNLNTLMPLMQKVASQVLVKLSPILDIKSILSEFDFIKEIHVVSVKNDCKELLILIDFSYTGEAEIIAINLETEQQAFHFKLSEEENSISQFELNDKYILEPNASILKAGAFKKLGVDFNLKKLHQHTHLYSSKTPITDFPGRIFHVIAVADKKRIKEYGKDGKLNVLTRNYPTKPDALKKKLKLKDGGNYFLIGFKDLNEKPNLVIAERVS